MTQECSRLQHQARDLEEEHRGHLAEVVADVEAMKKAMTDQRDDLDRAAQRAQRQHEEELCVQKARMATLTGDTLDVKLWHWSTYLTNQMCDKQQITQGSSSIAEQAIHSIYANDRQMTA